MKAHPVQLARDESITNGLGDSEARILVEALIFAVEREPWRHEELRLKAKLVNRMVFLWGRGDYLGAAQLAATTRIELALPPCCVSVESFTERIIVACLS